MIVPILQHYLPDALNFRGPLHVDWAGAGCALLLALIATLLAGAAPAWMSWHTQPQEALRIESRSASESRGGKRLRKFLCRRRSWGQRGARIDDRTTDDESVPLDAYRSRL